MHHAFTPPDFDPDFASPAEWAAMYRACGLQVVPARVPDPRNPDAPYKIPLIPWKAFQKTFAGDDVFNSWYGKGGEHKARDSMGVICGNVSDRVLMVDLDLYKGNAAMTWWLGVLATHNNNSELVTWEQITGGGGRQMFFHYPEGWRAPSNSTDIYVDVKGEGGFAMLPPSRHHTGNFYHWVKGRAPNELDILEAPLWLLEEVDRLIVEHGGSSAVSKDHGSSQESPESRYDDFGHQIDGRDPKMRDVVWASMVDLYRECPIKPSEHQLRMFAAEKYRVYEDLVNPQRKHPEGLTKTDKLELEKRGPTKFFQKWMYAARQWDVEVREAAQQPGKPDNWRADPSDEFTRSAEQAEVKAKAAPEGIYEYLTFNQIIAMPDPVWLVDGLINEKSLGFVFGPPGSLKTFIALDLALCIATTQVTWWGRQINHHGAVIYLCREGTGSLKLRLKAWELHRKVHGHDCPFHLIEKTMNFMKGEDVGKLVATIEAIAAGLSVPIIAVFVDTVSRVLSGAEENQQKDMSLFVGACDMVQQRFGCVVVGVHHVNRQGGIRGSSVIPGAGDFLIETRREPGAMTGSIVAQKVKDGEDGKEFPFKVTKVELGGIVPRSSLAVDPDEDPRVKVKGDDLPDMSVCREILSALAMAWFNKMPWGSSDNSARPAVRLIMVRWCLKKNAVRRLLDGWMANGVIEYAIYDPRKKLSGYRKIIDL